MHKRRAKRGKNLDDNMIEEIISIIDNWDQPKLTWNLLIEKIEIKLLSRYTRQGLARYDRIRIAVLQRKELLLQSSGSPNKKRSGILQVAMDKIERLERKNSRLQKENDLYLEQFARWAYNASNRGLSIDYLNKPLPKCGRT